MRNVQDSARRRVGALAERVVETTGDFALSQGARELRPSPSEEGAKLWYALGDPDEIHIIKIQSSEIGAGWGTALLLAVSRLHPERTRWTATSVNAESEEFWTKMRDRLGVELKIVPAPPHRR
jgi:hypothetical protein